MHPFYNGSWHCAQNDLITFKLRRKSKSIHPDSMANYALLDSQLWMAVALFGLQSPRDIKSKPFLLCHSEASDFKGLRPKVITFLLYVQSSNIFTIIRNHTIISRSRQILLQLQKPSKQGYWMEFHGQRKSNASAKSLPVNTAVRRSISHGALSF